VRVTTRSTRDGARRAAHDRLTVSRCVQSAAVLVVLVAAVTLVVVLAGSSAYADPPPPAPSVPSSVDVVLTNIRNWIMGILAGLATVFLTIGGVRYVLAGGDPGEVERAKTAFKSAGWGYGLAALAPLVVSILKQLVGVQ
jgi:hypothetical protein